MQTIEDKILLYIQSHKKPVTIKQMAKYFIVSDGGVQRALASLAAKGMVQIVPKSKPYLYKSM
jgi:Mn-dependent DtxR family transcriptional regulator